MIGVAEGDVAVEEADVREMQQRVLAEALPVRGGVGRAVGLVQVEHHAGGIGARLGLHHQRLARGAEPKDGDVAGDQRIGVTVAAEFPPH